MPAAIYAFAACAIGSDIYVFGGANNRLAQASVFKFDTEANGWRTLAPMPHASAGHSVSVLDGLVYIVGSGASGHDVLCYDPASDAYNTWLTPTLTGRHFGVSFVVDGCLNVAGGQDMNSSVERYDVASDTWTAMADMPEGRNFFGAVTIRPTGPVEEQDLFDSLITKASRQRT
jgi:hypothetical protein